MKKIQSIHLHVFRNDEHCEYHVVFGDLVPQFKTVEELVATLFLTHTNLLNREKQLLNTMHKSDYTKLIAEAAHRVDHAIIGMRGVVEATLHHFNPATAEAARSILNRIDAFGHLTRKAYEEETIDVNLLIEDFQGSYAAKVTLVGLTAWVTELQAAETEFETLLGERSVESAHKPQEQFRDVRREIDDVYNRMVDRINAAATLDDAGAYYEFVDQLNAQITYFNNHAHQRARKNLSAGEACVIEPIDLQHYTGKAITPVPAVHYREEGKPTVELVFGKDFTTTYRNNVNVGMAEIVVHGKGGYRGQKTVTFAIARI
ncbi:MAG: DUF6261 family protein [Tannerella sp.]|jgi:hypothetical protein|nr:DUF6261 family protein [Tannerella sp.]